MSVDVDIIPTTNKPITWIDLKFQLLSLPIDEEASILLSQKPNLFELGTNQEVKDEQVIVPTKYYYFRLAHNNSLTLSCENNVETYTNEQEYVEDFGQNVSETSRIRIAKNWAEIGYVYSIGSGGGRTKGELSLLVAIAESIARLSNGFILIKDNGIFSLSKGLYSPDEFSSCKLLF